MDFIDVGTKSVRQIGGSCMITLPPVVMKGERKPRGYRVEMNADKIVRLVPVYSLLVVAIVNFSFLVTARLLS